MFISSLCVVKNALNWHLTREAGGIHKAMLLLSLGWYWMYLVCNCVCVCSAGSWVNVAPQAAQKPWGERNGPYHRGDQRKPPDQRGFPQVRSMSTIHCLTKGQIMVPRWRNARGFTDPLRPCGPSWRAPPKNANLASRWRSSKGRDWFAH